MRALVYLLLFLVVTGLAHIASTFALPRLARSDVFSRLEAEAPVNTLAAIDDQAMRQLPFVDPAFALAVCRYDLADGPLRIRVPLSETFLAIVFAEYHRGIFSSVSDRAATGGSLDVVLATQAQLDRITKLDEEDQAVEEIRIVAPRVQGLAIMKVFADRPSSRERAAAVLRDARCDSETLPN
jgi:uncharacterized membrane protein